MVNVAIELHQQESEWAWRSEFFLIVRSGFGDGLRICNLRGHGGDGITVSLRMGRSMVP